MQGMHKLYTCTQKRDTQNLTIYQGQPRNITQIINLIEIRSIKVSFQVFTYTQICLNFIFY